ncbi:hypothetical protein N7457_009577 [Penicillium paradoxum]|uniref:uncharacterized protein n=1 Tax=Penicillium paradoxum TaxID=176176 RepID=UPI002548672B|nr:uncharacterized protein N7457_009577 [Penicillium paradoxum]KAJ5774681.1 hypothetical protein N7457_009577 [Penicillium paradoxum]
MAPAIRKVTHTFIQPDTTLVVVGALDNTKRWPARDLITPTATSPFTAPVQARDNAESYSEGKDNGLSNTDKGVIAGCVVSATLLLLLLCWCYLRRSRYPSWKSRFSTTKGPPEPSGPPSDDTPPDPAPTEKSSRTKKTVTIATDLPRYLRSKSTKSNISPLVRLSTEMNLKTGLATREGSSGQPVRFMIRQRDRPKTKRHRRHRRKRKAAKTDDAS